ncbi:MAG TPA: hypothetical protein DC053_20995 [Lachnoclostridium sp.]|jgi:hypothetical protein|nr:hypothetical protein [Lachnoclostridium sp.]
MQYCVHGELQEIQLKFDGCETILGVVIDNNYHDINTSSFRWLIQEEGDEKERLKECYYASDIWGEYYVTGKDSELDEHMEELRDAIANYFSNIEVKLTK